MILPYFKPNSNGFTLIEMMIVVGVIAIISGATIPSFSKYLKNQNLKQTQQNILSDMRSVQNRAMTGEASDEVVGSDPVAFWGMKFPNGANYYYVFYSALATNTVCTSVNDANAFRVEDFNSDYEIINTGNGCVFFDMSNGDLSIINLTPNNAIRVGDGTSNLDVFFNEAGLIYAQ